MTSNFRPGRKARHWEWRGWSGPEGGVAWTARNGASLTGQWGTSGGHPFKDAGSSEVDDRGVLGRGREAEGDPEGRGPGTVKGTHAPFKLFLTPRVVPHLYRPLPNPTPSPPQLSAATALLGAILAPPPPPGAAPQSPLQTLSLSTPLKLGFLGAVLGLLPFLAHPGPCQLPTPQLLQGHPKPVSQPGPSAKLSLGDTHHIHQTPTTSQSWGWGRPGPPGHRPDSDHAQPPSCHIHAHLPDQGPMVPHKTPTSLHTAACGCPGPDTLGGSWCICPGPFPHRISL